MHNTVLARKSKYSTYVKTRSCLYVHISLWTQPSLLAPNILSLPIPSFEIAHRALRWSLQWMRSLKSLRHQFMHLVLNTRCSILRSHTQCGGPSKKEGESFRAHSFKRAILELSGYGCGWGTVSLGRLCHPPLY